MSIQLSQNVKDIINASMKVSKRERAKSVDVFLKEGCFSIHGQDPVPISTADDEGTIVEQPLSEEFNRLSFWKYAIGILLIIIVLIIGYIYYTKGGSQPDKPQVEKASYQDYFEK